MDINAYMRSCVMSIMIRRQQIWMEHYVFFADAHERGGYS